MTDKPVYVETRALVEEVRQQGDDAATLALTGFYPQALQLSTWYLAVADRTALSPFDYLSHGLPTVANTRMEIPLPPQALYRQTRDCMDAFRSGYVDPAKLAEIKALDEAAKPSIEAALNAIIKGKGSYTLHGPGFGLPKVVTDAFYPSSLIAFIEKGINAQGLVSHVAPIQRKLLDALIRDEATTVARIGQEKSR